jgi:predicted AAA+ superfamily ATPase
MSKFIERQLQAEMLASAGEYPAVTVVGPRQSGKTTLVRKLFPDHAYVNLENPELRSLAQTDPKALLNRFPAPVILDEIQRVPELLSWLQVGIDENPTVKGHWIITGSNQLKLRESVTQTLAGRTALLTLLPLSIRELKAAGKLKPTFQEIIHYGCLPRIFDQNLRPASAWRDYYQTYVERDVKQLIEIQNQISFERFMRLLAGRVGQLVNLHALSNDVGVSSVTLSKWLSVLESSFIIFRLPPFHRNFGKRITKSPKLYFVDPGLAGYLLNLETPAQIERDPLMGGLFENLVVSEALKSRTNEGRQPNLYFFRDHNQNEVDLLYPEGGSTIPVEIKSAQTFDKSFARNIHYYQKVSGDLSQGRIIYNGETEFESDTYRVINFKSAF